MGQAISDFEHYTYGDRSLGGNPLHIYKPFFLFMRFSNSREYQKQALPAREITQKIEWKFRKELSAKV